MVTSKRPLCLRKQTFEAAILNVCSRPMADRALLSNLEGRLRPRSCFCGCGQMTKGGRFTPSHDSHPMSAMLAEVGGIVGLRPIVEAHLGHVADGHLSEIERREAAAPWRIGRRAAEATEAVSRRIGIVRRATVTIGAFSASVAPDWVSRVLSSFRAPKSPEAISSDRRRASF